MKLKVLYLIIALFTFSCKQQTVKNQDKTSLELKKEIDKKENIKLNKILYNFSNIVKCEKYGYDGIASIGDYGCLYNTKKNIYGNINLYLIPKDGILKHLEKVDKLFEGDKYDKWEKEGNRINNLSIQKIKQEFNIYLFLVPKEYLEHTPTLDASYNIKQNEGANYKFKTKFYGFNDKTKKWDLIDTFETLQKTKNKAWKWEQKKIKEIIDRSN